MALEDLLIRQMPHSLEAEQAVLGSILIDPDCMTTVVEYLKSEYFFLPQHRSIFAAMVTIDTPSNDVKSIILPQKLIRLRKRKFQQ